MTGSAGFRWGAALALVAGFVVWFATGDESCVPTVVRTPVAPSNAPVDPSPAPSPRDEVSRRNAEREAARVAAETETAAVAPFRLRIVSGGKPVAGARAVAEDAELVRHEATSDADGLALFDPPIESDYARIDVSAPGMTRVHFIEYKPGSPPAAVRTVELVPGTGIEGIVVEKGTRRVVAGARVEVPGAISAIAETETDAAGVFRLDDVPSGAPVTLRVTEVHHLVAAATWDPARGSRNEIALEPAGAIRGVVTEPSGAPAAWAQVTATGELRDPRWGSKYPANVTVSTDVRGCYVLGGLALDATWTLSASRTGLADSLARPVVAFGPGQSEASHDFVLRAPAHLKIVVLRADGAPAVDAVVLVTTLAGERSPSSRDTGGARVLDVYAPGSCTIDVTSTTAPPKSVDVDLEPGETRTIDVRLDAGVSIRGVVVDDLGRGIGGAAVSLSSRAGGPARDATSADGGAFVFEGLAPGRCVVTAREGESALRSGVEVDAPSDAVRLVLPRPGRLSLRVRAGSGTSAPAGFRVTVADPISPSGNRISFVLRTVQCVGDEYRGPVPACTSTVYVLAEGFQTFSRQITVLPGEETSLGDIVLEPDLVLEGRVVDDQGNAFRGAVVTVGPGRTAQTDVDGAFRIEGLAPEEYVVAVGAGGGARVRVTHRLAPGAAPLVVILRRGGGASLICTVLDAAGVPARGSEVVVEVTSRDRPDDVVADGWPDEHGRFLAGLVPGPWRVNVKRNGLVVATKDVDLREGEETKVDVAPGK